MRGHLPDAAEEGPTGETAGTQPARGGAQSPEPPGLRSGSGSRHFIRHGSLRGGPKVPNLKNEAEQSDGAEVRGDGVHCWSLSMSSPDNVSVKKVKKCTFVRT